MKTIVLIFLMAKEIVRFAAQSIRESIAERKQMDEFYFALLKGMNER